MDMNLEEIYADGEYGVFSRAKLWERAPAKTYIIEHLLYDRDVMCISSKAGVGKSVLTLQMMCCLTSGTNFLDTYKVYRPCNVLYIQTEGDRAETLERLTAMRKMVPLDDSRWAHINLPGIAINDPKEFQQLVAAVRNLGMPIDVIIIDPLYTTVKGDMSKNEVSTDWIRNIRWLKAFCDCAVIVNNHEGKDVYNEGVAIDRGAVSIFGSTFWAAFFNQNYRLKVYDGHHLLEIGKNRSGKAVDKIAMRMVTDGTLAYIPHDETATVKQIKVETILREGRPVGAKELVKLSGLSQATVYRVIRKLEDEGKIERVFLDGGIGYQWVCQGADISLDKAVEDDRILEPEQET